MIKSLRGNSLALKKMNSWFPKQLFKSCRIKLKRTSK